MKNKNTPEIDDAMQAYALRLTTQLTHTQKDLGHDITERLRAARVQALAQRKKAALPVVHVQAASALQYQGGQGGSASLGWGSDNDEGATWWRTLVSALALLALLIGLTMVNINQGEVSSTEIAELDTALLTDVLPPAAYTDPGFLQYMKTGLPSQ